MPKYSTEEAQPKPLGVQLLVYFHGKNVTSQSKSYVHKSYNIK